MTRRYARLYASPAEIRKLDGEAKRRDLSLSDYVRARMNLPAIYSRRKAGARGAAHHAELRAVLVRISEDEAVQLEELARAIDATDCDLMRVACGLPRLRGTRTRGGAPMGNRNNRLAED